MTTKRIICALGLACLVLAAPAMGRGLLGQYPIVYPPMKLEPAAAGSTTRTIDVFYKNRDHRSRYVDLQLDMQRTKNSPIKVDTGHVKFKWVSTHNQLYTRLTMKPGQVLKVRLTFTLAVFNRGRACATGSSWVLDDNSDNRSPYFAGCPK
jgi:hypothetical protein